MKTAEQRIAAALNSMPYGAGLVLTTKVTMESVAIFLESLSARLHGVASINTENEMELRELREQRRAIRAFLGLTEEK